MSCSYFNQVIETSCLLLLTLSLSLSLTPVKRTPQKMATEVVSVQSETLWKKPEDPIYYIDPSEHFRPEGKKEEEFRVYTLDKVSLVISFHETELFRTSLFTTAHDRMIRFKLVSETHISICIRIKRWIL